MNLFKISSLLQSIYQEQYKHVFQQILMLDENVQQHHHMLPFEYLRTKKKIIDYFNFLFTYRNFSFEQEIYRELERLAYQMHRMFHDHEYFELIVDIFYLNLLNHLIEYHQFFWYFQLNFLV